MVFKRTNRSNRRRFQSRRRTFTRGNVKITKGPTTLDLDRKIKKLQHTIELKHWSNDFGGALGSGIPAISEPLGSIVKGSDDNDRDGDSLVVTSLRWNVNIESGNIASGKVRLLIVRDTASGTAADFTHNLITLGTNEFWDGNSYTTRPQVWMYNPDHVGYRYRVLYDKVHSIDPHVANGGTAGVHGIVAHIKVKKSFAVQYDDVAAYTTPVKNAVYFIAISDTGVSMYSTVRVYYKDP